MYRFAFEFLLSNTISVLCYSGSEDQSLCTFYQKSNRQGKERREGRQEGWERERKSLKSYFSLSVVFLKMVMEEGLDFELGAFSVFQFIPSSFFWSHQQVFPLVLSEAHLFLIQVLEAQLLLWMDFQNLVFNKGSPLFACEFSISCQENWSFLISLEFKIP